MLLSQISPSDPVTNAALLGFMKTATILNSMQFIDKEGAATIIKRAREATAKTLITRAINTDNTPTAPTPVEDTATKKIVSYDAKVDVVLEDRYPNANLGSELANQTYLESIEAGREFQNLIFNGDSGAVATDFDGMAQLVQSAYTLETGEYLPLGNSDSNFSQQQKAIETLLSTIEFAEGITDMYVNNSVRWRWVSIAKNLGYYTKSIDELGNEIPGIMGVRIHGAGKGPDKAQLLPFNETVDGTPNCSRIYLAAWGEGVDLTMITSVGLKGRYAGQIGNHYINNVNMDAVMHLQNHAALVVSKGWRITAP